MPPIEQLKEILDYNPETGVFTWKIAAGAQLAGRRAGSFRNNNYGIIIDKKITSGARLAWLFVYGELPSSPIRFVSDDHRDIRIANLRLSKTNAARDAEKLAAAAARKQKRDAVWGWREVTQGRLRQLFDYNPETGKFFWKESGKGRTLGEPAGSVDNGHMVLRVDGISHQQQRLAWIYVYGAVPEGRRIRFENEDSLDCRIGNLRLARSKTEHNDRFHARHPEAKRKGNLHRYQGMTIPDYEALFAAQGGVCAVCHQPETQKRHGILRPLVVDHHHGDGDVRGLLCSRCNTMIGFSKEDPERLRRAAQFISNALRPKLKIVS